MKTHPAIALASGLLLAGCGMQPAKEESPKPESAASEAAQTCDQCGTIEAIVQKVVSLNPGGYAGAAGYFVYDLYIRMDKTGHLRVVTVETQGALDRGQRVKVFGGSVEPVI